MQASHAEHADLVKAMSRGDAAEAAIIMREHMLNASDALMRVLDGTSPSDPLELADCLYPSIV